MESNVNIEKHDVGSTEGIAHPVQSQSTSQNPSEVILDGFETAKGIVEKEPDSVKSPEGIVEKEPDSVKSPEGIVEKEPDMDGINDHAKSVDQISDRDGCIEMHDGESADKKEHLVEIEKEGGSQNNQEHTPQPMPMSKRQMKRERKKTYFLDVKLKRRKKERENKKAKRVAIKESGKIPPPRKLHANLMSKSLCKQRICIDMAYAPWMTKQQLSGVFAQLSFCYAANRRADEPTQLTFTNFNGATEALFYADPCRQTWDVKINEGLLCEVFNKQDIVYLTADSDNVLQTLNDTKVYVIGGLLDHNSLKDMCFTKANELGVAHARLPIDDYVKMRTRQVLTINQVFEILLKYTQDQSWKKAFEEVIPKRRLDTQPVNDQEEAKEKEDI